MSTPGKTPLIVLCGGGLLNTAGFYGIKLGAEVGLPEGVLKGIAATTNPIATMQDYGLLPKYEEVAYPILKAPAPSPAFGPQIENTWFFKGLTLGKQGLIGFTKQGEGAPLENPALQVGGNIKYGIGSSGITRTNLARGETSRLTLGTPVTSLTQQIIATGGEGTPLSEGSQFGSNMFLKNIVSGSYKLTKPTTAEMQLNAVENPTLSSSLLSSGETIDTSRLSSGAVLLDIPQSESDLVLNNQLFGVNTMKAGEPSPLLSREYETVYPNAPFNMSEMQVDRLLTLAEVSKSGKGVKPEVVRNLPDKIFKNLKEGPQTETVLKQISKYQKPFAFGIKGIKSGDWSLGITKGSTSQINQVLPEYNRLAGDIEHLPLNSKILMHKFLQETTNELNKVAEPNQLFENTFKPEFKTGEDRTRVERLFGLNKEGLKLIFKGKPEIKVNIEGTLVHPELSESISIISESTKEHPFYLGGKQEDVFQFAGGKDENGKYISTSGFVWGERTPEGFVTAKTEAGTKIRVSTLRKQELRKNAATSSLMSERLAGQSRNITVEEFRKISGISGEQQGVFPIPHRAKDVGDTLGTSLSNADKLFKQGKKNQAIYKAAVTEHMRDVFPTYDFQTMFAKKPGSLEYHIKNIKPDLSNVMNIGKQKLEEPTGIFRPSPPVLLREERIPADYSFESKNPESLLRITKKPNAVPIYSGLTQESNLKENKESSLKNINPSKTRESSLSSIIPKNIRPPSTQPSNLKSVAPPSVKTVSPPSYTPPSNSPPFGGKPYLVPAPPNVPTKTTTFSPLTGTSSLSSLPSAPDIFTTSPPPPTREGIIPDLNTKPDQKRLIKIKERANFLGNSSISTLVGLYNRQEIIYGKARTAKISGQVFTKETKGFPKFVTSKSKQFETVKPKIQTTKTHSFITSKPTKLPKPHTSSLLNKKQYKVKF